jgi:hypothetical protein
MLRILAGVFQLIVMEEDASQTFCIAQSLLIEKAPDFMIDQKDVFTLNTATLIDDPLNFEIATFELFVKWLDSESQSLQDDPTLSPLYVAYKKKSWYNLIPIIKIYIFAEGHNIPQLRKDALHQLSIYMSVNMKALGPKWFSRRTFCNHDIDSEVVEYVYTYAAPDSLLRRFFVDSYRAAYVEESNQTYALMCYPKEFLVDVMVRRTVISGKDGVMSGIKEAVRRVEEWQVYGEETRKTTSMHD